MQPKRTVFAQKLANKISLRQISWDYCNIFYFSQDVAFQFLIVSDVIIANVKVMMWRLQSVSTSFLNFI